MKTLIFKRQRKIGWKWGRNAMLDVLPVREEDERTKHDSVILWLHGTYVILQILLQTCTNKVELFKRVHDLGKKGKWFVEVYMSNQAYWTRRSTGVGCYLWQRVLKVTWNMRVSLMGDILAQWKPWHKLAVMKTFCFSFKHFNSMEN